MFHLIILKSKSDDDADGVHARDTLCKRNYYLFNLRSLQYRGSFGLIDLRSSKMEFFIKDVYTQIESQLKTEYFIRLRRFSYLGVILVVIMVRCCCSQLI